LHSVECRKLKMNAQCALATPIEGKIKRHKKLIKLPIYLKLRHKKRDERRLFRRRKKIEKKFIKKFIRHFYEKNFLNKAAVILNILEQDPN
jgi:hypothetical protein